MDVASLLVKIGLRADTAPLENLQSKLESINGKLRILAGAEVIRGLFHLTENFGHSALELENTAAAAGLTTEAMQKLQFAVAQSGGNASELGMTLSHLSRLIQGAKLGSEEAIQVFYKLGISQQAITSYKTTEDALYGVMDALRQIKDPIKQHALLDQALGQGSRGLGRFALAGSAAAKQTIAGAKQMGAIMPASTIRQLANAKASLDGLGQILKAVSGTIGGAFAPALMQAVRGLEHFYAANKDFIEAKIEAWVGKISYAFGELYAVVYLVARAITDFVKRHQKLVDLALDWAPALIAVSLALPKVITPLRILASVMTGLQLVWAAFSLETVGIAVGLTAVTAIFTLMGAAIVSCFEAMNGSKWENTTFFKLMDTARAGGSLLKSLGLFAGGKLGELTAALKLDAEAAQPLPQSLYQQGGVGRYADGGSLFAKGQPLLDRLNAVQYDTNTPPTMLAQPALSSARGNMSYEPNIVNNNTITVPPGTSPADAQKMVTNGLQIAQDKAHMQALQRFYNPALY